MPTVHYKQLLAYVYVGDTFVNVEMVRQGQAVMYTVPPNVAHVEKHRKAQAEAREAGRGVWNPEHPLNGGTGLLQEAREG